KVLDEILTHGGNYLLKEIRIGQKQADPSYARIEVRAENTDNLQEILDAIHDHGAVPVAAADCTSQQADMDGAFPEGFYSSTNYATQVGWKGEWVDVENRERDGGILLDPEGGAARCLPMASVKKGDRIVVGRQGLRFSPAETMPRQSLFEFMNSSVS